MKKFSSGELKAQFTVLHRNYYVQSTYFFWTAVLIGILPVVLCIAQLVLIGKTNYYFHAYAMVIIVVYAYKWNTHEKSKAKKLQITFNKIDEAVTCGLSLDEEYVRKHLCE